MDLLQSPFRITMHGAVLLGFDDYVPEGSEPEVPWEIGGETIPLINAPYALQFIASANAVNRLQFNTVRLFDTQVLAQLARLSLQSDLPTDVYDVTIETRDSNTWTLADARIEGPVNPVIRDGRKLVFSVKLAGGALTMTGEPDWDLLGDCEPL